MKKKKKTSRRCEGVSLRGLGAAIGGADGGARSAASTMSAPPLCAFEGEGFGLGLQPRVG